MNQHQPNTGTPDRTLSAAQAAGLLNVSPYTVRQWARNGKIEHQTNPDSRRLEFTEAHIAAIGDLEPLLTTKEVAAMFCVDPQTVTRWARAGKLPGVCTPGGRRRFRRSEIRKFLTDDGQGGGQS